ncbi:hypothetical protein PR048_003803 [Dryococelus australis]|uniref:Glycoside hydrolase family 38 central domain-containing protein n=1 Tax=Dryococelus australis TaxID=614101 RepID=A0ABQ9IP24_9NEOP|nr:hypothetical protein PR048_003803 [Dryococelus australis]
MSLVDGFSRGSPVSPTPSFRRSSIFTSNTLIGSQDFAVKSRPNLFTHAYPYPGPPTLLIYLSGRGVARHVCGERTGYQSTREACSLRLAAVCEHAMLVISVLACVVAVCGLPLPLKPQPSTCGYQSCPETQSGMLNVHLVPHSHDDVGWLKTVDQYYYGKFDNIQRAGVQYIIDSVVGELTKDPSKRFIQVETAFFWKWWLEQDDDMRQTYRKLVNSGQIEMIGGGWSMNDEAATHYQSTVDNFSWGLRRLNDTFGECGRPRIGWQIDPFGHSRETASIMARMGFDGLFFGRLDYQDKQQRLQNKTMEMMWKASANLGSEADLFTGVNYNGYSYPSGFCFDINCSDEPIIEDVDSPEYNVPERLKSFIDQVKKQAASYATDNVMLTMGGDFNYMEAHMNYKNMDKLIRLVNGLQTNGSEIHLLYSTPSCYLKAVHEANVTLTTKTDDFFPYASDEHSYWTGYFTSRPTQKRFERTTNNMLQVCKQLSVLARLSGEEEERKLNWAREAQGVMQHHDAITGTAKQAVANDYSRILTEAVTSCSDVSRTAINGAGGDMTGSRAVVVGDVDERSVAARSHVARRLAGSGVRPASRLAAKQCLTLNGIERVYLQRTRNKHNGRGSP